MKWEYFLSQFSNQPLFHSSMLAIFDEPALQVQVQLSRWVNQGKLAQIRRGWYLIEEPFRKTHISAARIATQVVHPSYLSMEWALAYYGMIPENVTNLTCVTTQRAFQFAFKNQTYYYKYINPAFFTGYSLTTIDHQQILLAGPEKSLMDKIYLFLQSSYWSLSWLKELRLQNMEDFDCSLFKSFVELVKMRKLKEVAIKTCKYIEEEIK